MTPIQAQALFTYVIPLLLIWATYVRLKSRSSQRNKSIREEEFEAGLTEPASLHPVIDGSKCMGCGTCVSACPEQHNHSVLGLINNQAELIAPTNCIGHGACKTACPFDAITLVFGTERRGVDIPIVSSEFETNMPGIYIAGELGGMGLIRNAIEQGKQAMESILKACSKSHRNEYDVVIVGAGPSGFSATLAAHHHKIRYATIEQESLGGTVFQFPRGKLVMTAPVDLPIVGKVRFTDTSKEKLLEFWQEVEQSTGIDITYKAKVDSIVKTESGYCVSTTHGDYHTETVLLTIGRRGTPRKLGVPGENLSKVVYRLIDPEQYRQQHVLVVGGGDSALEAACSIAEEAGTSVTLSYRSGAFSRAKRKNRERVENLQNAGRLNVMLKSNVQEFTEDHVGIEHDGNLIQIRNDAAIVCAGGILPTGFLKEIGIQVETKNGSE